MGQWLPLATTAFFGLLRAIHAFTLNYTQNDIRITYSSTLTHTGKHCSMGRAELARKHCCKAHGSS